MEHNTIQHYTDELFARAREVQEEIAQYTQEQVNTLVKAVARAITKPENLLRICELSLEESKMGDLESKLIMLNTRIKGVCWDIRNDTTVGIIEENPERGLVKVARPIGVVACLIPNSHPEVTAIINTIFCLKGRNASVHAPYHKLQKSTLLAFEIMRETLKKHGAPEDLILCASEHFVTLAHEIMQMADLVIATDDDQAVRDAQYSGTPAYGTSRGNANVIIDETADIAATAALLVKSKVFDQSSGHSCESSIIVHESLYNDLILEMIDCGAFVVNNKQKQLLQKELWLEWPTNRTMNCDLIAKPARTIAKAAGFDVPEDTRLILVEESGSGMQHAFAGEKQCPVLTVYKYSNFCDAINIVMENQEYKGRGHSCGIHTMRDDRIMKVAEAVKTARVAVRQSMAASNSGSWASGNKWTSTLGCGTWAGNIVSGNITTEHFINTTWISRPIPAYIPTDDELFGDLIND